MTAVLSQTHATAKAAPLILLMIIFIDGLGTALLLPMLPMLLDPGDLRGWFRQRTYCRSHRLALRLAVGRLRLCDDGGRASAGCAF